MQRRLGKAQIIGLLLGCSCALVGNMAYAETDEYGLNSTRDVTIYVGGMPFANIHYFENGSITYQGKKVNLMEMPEATYGKELQAAINYWAQVIGVPKASVPDINIYGLDINSLNASANSKADNQDGHNNTRLANCFLLDHYEGSKPSATISIYTGYKDWNFGDLSVLPQTDKVNLAGVILHEMFHALGVSSGKSSSWVLKLDNIESYYPVIKKANKAFDTYLTDMYGHKLSQCIYLYAYDAAKASTDNKIYNNVFYVTTNSSNLAEERYGGVYFTGENVQNVLAGATLAWPDDEDGHLGRVAGIPINGIEISKAKNILDFELSHFELQNSLQSHQSYRNWFVPMEVELAAMQDLGYNIDLRKFYGRSIYNDDLTLTNTVGYNEVQDYGIGLHVYGIGNTVNQVADITADGAYALGVRVDGAGYTKATSAKNSTIRSQGNNLTIAAGTTVAANGYQGRGIDFAYGKNHTLTVDGTVTALGEGGRALCFDFGNNANADTTESRGSYLRTKSGKSTSLLTALAGPLVTTATLNGTVAGTEAAIFISSNALVKTININDGASIFGNIISDWQNTGVTGLQLPTDEDGMTTINFGSLNYNGNIANSSNGVASTLNLNVQGDLQYSGTAKVNKLTIAQGGKLWGGNYVVSQGVVNKGTIGAVTPTDSNTSLTIQGDLELQDQSSVQFTGNVDQLEQKTGLVSVQGGVLQKGVVQVTIDANGKYLPGSYSVLQKNSTDEQLTVANTVAGTKGLLQAEYNTNIGKITFAVNSNNTILTAEQTQAVQAVDTDRVQNTTKYVNGLSSAEKNRYVEFLNTSDEAFQRQVAGDLTSKASAEATRAVQRNNVIGRIVRTRLANVNRDEMIVPVQVTSKALTENKKTGQPTVTTNITVPLQRENSFWANVDRNWADAGDMNARQTTMNFGYDKAYGGHSRAGVLLSCGRGSVTGAQKNDRLQDYRLGFYNNFHNGADDMTVYLDYGTQKHDAKRYVALRDQALQNDYHSKIFELGAEYKYDWHARDGKIFHVAPYVNTVLSRYWQDGYDEGLFGQKNSSFAGNYFTTGLGIECSRNFKLGSYSARLGYKHIWDGAATTLNYNLGGMGFAATSKLDKNFFTASYSGAAKLNNHGWSLEGDAHLEKGAHDKNYGVIATLKWEW